MWPTGEPEGNEAKLIRHSVPPRARGSGVRNIMWIAMFFLNLCYTCEGKPIIRGSDVTDDLREKTSTFTIRITITAVIAAAIMLATTVDTARHAARRVTQASSFKPCGIDVLSKRGAERRHGPRRRRRRGRPTATRGSNADLLTVCGKAFTFMHLAIIVSVCGLPFSSLAGFLTLLPSDAKNAAMNEQESKEETLPPKVTPDRAMQLDWPSWAALRGASWVQKRCPRKGGALWCDVRPRGTQTYWRHDAVLGGGCDDQNRCYWMEDAHAGSVWNWSYTHGGDIERRANVFGPLCRHHVCSAKEGTITGASYRDFLYTGFQLRGGALRKSPSCRTMFDPHWAERPSGRGQQYYTTEAFNIYQYAANDTAVGRDKRSTEGKMIYRSSPTRTQDVTSNRSAQLYWPCEADLRGGCLVQKRQSWKDVTLGGTAPHCGAQLYWYREAASGGGCGNWRRHYRMEGRHMFGEGTNASHSDGEDHPSRSQNAGATPGVLANTTQPFPNRPSSARRECRESQRNNTLLNAGQHQNRSTPRTTVHVFRKMHVQNTQSRLIGMHVGGNMQGKAQRGKCRIHANCGGVYGSGGEGHLQQGEFDSLIGGPLTRSQIVNRFSRSTSYDAADDTSIEGAHTGRKRCIDIEDGCRDERGSSGCEQENNNEPGHSEDLVSHEVTQEWDRSNREKRTCRKQLGKGPKQKQLGWKTTPAVTPNHENRNRLGAMLSLQLTKEGNPTPKPCMCQGISNLARRTKPITGVDKSQPEGSRAWRTIRECSRNKYHDLDSRGTMCNGGKIGTQDSPSHCRTVHKGRGQERPRLRSDQGTCNADGSSTPATWRAARAFRPSAMAQGQWRCGVDSQGKTGHTTANGLAGTVGTRGQGWADADNFADTACHTRHDSGSTAITRGKHITFAVLFPAVLHQEPHEPQHAAWWVAGIGSYCMGPLGPVAWKAASTYRHYVTVQGDESMGGSSDILDNTASGFHGTDSVGGRGASKPVARLGDRLCGAHFKSSRQTGWLRGRMMGVRRDDTGTPRPAHTNSGHRHNRHNDEGQAIPPPGDRQEENSAIHHRHRDMASTILADDVHRSTDETSYAARTFGHGLPSSQSFSPPIPCRDDTVNDFGPPSYGRRDVDGGRDIGTVRLRKAQGARTRIKKHRHASATDTGEKKGHARTATGGQEATSHPAPHRRRDQNGIAITHYDELAGRRRDDGDGVVMSVVVYGGNWRRRRSLLPVCHTCSPSPSHPPGRAVGGCRHAHAGGRARIQDTRAGRMMRSIIAHNSNNNRNSIVCSDAEKTWPERGYEMARPGRRHGHLTHNKQFSFDGRQCSLAARRRNKNNLIYGILSYVSLLWASTIRQLPLKTLLAPPIRGGGDREIPSRSLREATNALIIDKRRWCIIKRRGRQRKRLTTHTIFLPNFVSDSPREEPATRVHAFQHNTIADETNSVEVALHGTSLLDLRGGGPHPAAGVLSWLYESDDEDVDDRHDLDNGTSELRHDVRRTEGTGKPEERETDRQRAKAIDDEVTEHEMDEQGQMKRGRKCTSLSPTLPPIEEEEGREETSPQSGSEGRHGGPEQHANEARKPLRREQSEPHRRTGNAHADDRKCKASKMQDIASEVSHRCTASHHQGRDGAPEEQLQLHECSDRTIRGLNASRHVEPLRENRHSPSWETQDVYDREQRHAASGARYITGEVNHTRIVVCSHCLMDIPDTEFHLHTCGGPTDVREQAAYDSTDWGWGQTGPDTNNGCEEPHTPRTAPQEKTWDETICQGCSLPLLTAGVQWRICRCFLPYCIACASGPCTSCCVLQVWSGDEEPEEQQEDQTTDTTGQGPTRWETGTESRVHQPTSDAPRGPEEIHRDRRQQIDEARSAMQLRRKENRQVRKDQIRAGTRPRREQERVDDEVTFATTNATCHNSLKRELEHGETFRKCQYILLQEHGLSGEQRTQGEAWAVKQGLDAIIDSAYFKEARNGGGTGILADINRGVRRSVSPTGELDGRFTIGIGQMDGEFIAGSWYGISGGTAAKQLPLLIKMAELLKAIGLPFVIGGDWQIPPEQLEATGIPRALNATIIAPTGATNLHSKKCMDYFMVSWPLAQEGHQISIDYGASLATHAPVMLRLKAKRARGGGRRLARARLLPVNKPHGPIRGTIGVDWARWTRLDQMNNNESYDEEVATTAVAEWYAGAEYELLNQFGIEEDEQGPYIGMGIEPKVVEGSQQGRFRNTTNEEGLIGHRAAWTCRALQLIITHASAVHKEGPQSKATDILTRIGHRAGAFHKAWKKEITKLKQGGSPCDDSHTRQRHVDDACTQIKLGLDLVRRLVTPVHRSTPWLIQIRSGTYTELILKVTEARNGITNAAHEVAKDRHHRDLQALRKWAKGAAPRLAHRITKPTESVVRKTASAAKHHQGECTAQQAADKGSAEWGNIWKAKEVDQAEDIVRAVEDLYQSEMVNGGDNPIVLPPLTGSKLKWAGSTMNAETGVGMDGSRPRHIIYLTDAAREALAQLLTLLEKYRRWPHLLRAVIEIARGKKAGGSRLIGISSTLYRLWARARYADIRDTVEKRLRRAYLAAAPGKGAAQAVFEQAWNAEAARTEGEETATTLVDFEKYYECIDVAEIADGAKRIGLPLPVTVLAVHLYLGPRRISVDKTISAALYPSRSILAGCTWATLLIRAIIIKPADALQRIIQEKIKNWGVKINMTLFVDDGAFSTRGTVSKVEHIHSWLTRLVLNWVRNVLRKKVSQIKLVCIAGSARLKPIYPNSWRTQVVR